MLHHGRYGCTSAMEVQAATLNGSRFHAPVVRFNSGCSNSGGQINLQLHREHDANARGRWSCVHKPRLLFPAEIFRSRRTPVSAARHGVFRIGGCAEASPAASLSHQKREGRSFNMPGPAPTTTIEPLRPSREKIGHGFGVGRSARITSHSELLHSATASLFLLSCNVCPEFFRQRAVSPGRGQLATT